MKKKVPQEKVERARRMLNELIEDPELFRAFDYFMTKAISRAQESAEEAAQASEPDMKC